MLRAPLATLALLGSAGGLSVAFASGLYFGGQRAELACLKGALADQQASAEQSRGIDSDRVEIERDHSMTQSQLEEVQAVQTREVIRYVQVRSASTCRLGADGMRLWNAANAGTLPEPTATASAGAVPGAIADAGVGHRAGNGRQPRRVGADVSPVPPTASAPGAMGGG